MVNHAINQAWIHIINATPLKKVRWYSFRLPKQKTKEVSNENIQPSNPRRKCYAVELSRYTCFPAGMTSLRINLTK